MNFKTSSLWTLAFAIVPCVAHADSDVTSEKAEQNTPSGWTAVELPSIPTISASNTFDITNYGATTSSADNTTAIQEALNAVTSNGGMVVIPAGTWLCGPLTIKAKTVLHLAAGATLKMLPYGCGSDGTTAPAAGYYPSTKTAAPFAFNQLLVNAKNASDIIVEGEGETSIFEGQGETWWDKRNVLGTRPQFCRFTSGSRFLFRNFKMHNSPGVNLTLGQSGKVTNFTVHDIIISNPSSETAQTTDGVVSHNTDGIPVWGAYMNIYNCNISTGDDNIVVDSNAQYVHVWNVNCGYGHGMSMGSYTEKVHDIIYEDITFKNTSSGFRLKTSTGRSGNDQDGTNSNGAVKNIICRNATMTGVPCPIKITSWYDSDSEKPSSVKTPSTVTYQTPEFCDILFQNITATEPSASNWKNGSAIYLYGRPEMYIHDVTFDNVSVASANYGMFLAYCKNIKFTNACKVTNESSSTKYISTEYNAYTDDGTTKISADKSLYDGTLTSGIETVKNADGIAYSSNIKYDLAGQKAKDSTKGIIISNGKKYLK